MSDLVVNATETIGNRILVTGFGPFQGHPWNPSQEIAINLHGCRVHGYELTGCALETSWARAWPRLRAAAEVVRPVALIMLGVCGNDFFRLEHCARNVFTPEADVDGVLMFAGKNAVLVEGGPGSYVTTLPFGALWENLEQSISLEFGQPFANVDGIGVARSEDAGEFICNQVYYLACHFLSSSIPYIGFLHVPSISCFAEGFWAHQRTLSVGAKLVSTIAGLLRVR